MLISALATAAAAIVVSSASSLPIHAAFCLDACDTHVQGRASAHTKGTRPVADVVRLLTVGLWDLQRLMVLLQPDPTLAHAQGSDFQLWDPEAVIAMLAVLSWREIPSPSRSIDSCSKSLSCVCLQLQWWVLRLVSVEGSGLVVLVRWAKDAVANEV